MSNPPLALSVDGHRMYQHPVTSDLYPSITSIIGVLDKPAIVGWAARETAGAAWDNRHALVQMEHREAAVDMLKNARYRTMEKRANVGTTVHEVAEALARDEHLPPYKDEHVPYIDRFLEFVAEFEPTFTLVEATVFSDEHRYAGTVDFAVLIEGLLVLGDHKTGKGVYAEVAMQLAAARFAETVWDRLTGELRPMPKIDGAIAVHLRPEQCTVYLVDASERAFRAFLGARQAWPWMENGESTGAVGAAMNRTRLVRALQPRLEVVQ